MSDLRYGRIFSERDVQKIIEKAVELGAEVEAVPPLNVVLGLLEGQELEIPVEEPQFLLRAADDGAAQALNNFYEHCLSSLESYATDSAVKFGDWCEGGGEGR